MKQKVRYLLMPFVFFILTLGIFNGKAIEAQAVSNNNWSVGTQQEAALADQNLAKIQEQVLTPKKATLSFFGYSNKGTLQVIKYDSKTKARLAGAQFTIYNLWGQSVQVIETNSSGIAQTNSLALGYYSIKETKAPKGYRLESSAMFFSLLRCGQKICLTKCNDKESSEKGSLQVIKKNETNEVLAGAVFNVYNSNNELVGKITTGADGTASLSGLPLGTYKLVEETAPDGYQLDTTPKYVTITSTTKTAVITIQNKKLVGKIQVVKKDEAGQVLAGAIFEVFDANNNLVGTVTTNAQGIATLNDLPYGTYKLVETKAPNGYVLDQTPQYVTVSKDNPNGVASLTVTNKKEVTTGDLEIIKQDEADNRLAGAEFDVFNSSDQLVAKVTTDANGVASLSNLPFGTYKLVETKAPAGYELDAAPHSVTVSKTDPNGRVSITIINKKEVTTGDLEVIKKDEAGARLAEAEFEVYDNNNQLIGKVTTDVNGVASLSDLPFGTYKLIETKAPAGYELDATPQYVTISKDSTNGKATIEIVNREIVPETGALKIVKYVKGSDPIAYLPGAVFEVYDQDTQLVGTYTTDANGEILLNDLEPGKYYVVEVEAPPGYEEDTTFYEVTVEAGKVAEIRHANVKKENLGSLKITKYAKDRDGFETDTVLPGAEFEIKDATGNIHKGTTDINGEIFLSDLPVGEVEIKEVKAPDGYTLDGATQTTTIAVGTIADAVFYNAPKQQQGRALVYVTSPSDRVQKLNRLEFKIKCKKGSSYETTVATNSFGQISVYLAPGEYEIIPTVTQDEGLTPRNYLPESSCTFKIEANKFTVVRLSI
ncbi:hypothetical protein GIX45_07145 [Erwinia sp. CPCC 100877]|nr:hypothetical protein [Erwinia sp. CPCC 100877]